MKNKILMTALAFFMVFGASAKNDSEKSQRVIFEGPYEQAILFGASHILGNQCDNGGWSWEEHNCDDTPSNILNPIADGLLEATKVTGITDFLDGAVLASDYFLSETEPGGSSTFPNDSPKLTNVTPWSFWKLSAETGDITYTDWVETNFYQVLLIGTYGGDMDTTEYIDTIRPTRPNLKVWDLAPHLLAAERYCHKAISQDFEQALLDSLNVIDFDSSFDVIALASGVQGLADINRLNFPPIVHATNSDINGIDTLKGLADYLLSLQNPDGSFNYQSTVVTGGEDTQTTAFAIMALIKAEERLQNEDYIVAIESAKDWIVTVQIPGGGIPYYPGGTEYTEIEAEAIQALATEGVYDRIFQGQMECYVN